MKLHYKLSLTFSIIIMLTFIVVFVYLDVKLNRKNISDLREAIKRQTEAASLSIMNLDQGRSTLQGLTKGLGNALNLRVTLISSTGNVVADSEVQAQELRKLDNHLQRPEVQEAANGKEGWSQRFSTTLKRDILYYAAPLSSPAFSGFIRLAVPVERLSIITHSTEGVLLIALVGAFIASLLAALVAFNLISRPISDLAIKANEIAHGDFSRKLFSRSRDEVGGLTDSFNTMSEKIRDKMNEIIVNNSKFEAVLMSMSEGVMVMDSSGVIQLMNDALKNILETKEEPIGKRPIEVIRNLGIQEAAEKVLKTDSKLVTREESLVLSKNKTILINASPVTRKGVVIGAVMVFSDITELRKLETVRRDFVANVSHELRTPISNIRGYSETLLEGALADKDNALEFIKVIHSESERLASLINDILDLSRTESDNFNLNVKPCSLSGIVEGTINRLKRDISDKNIKIKILIDREPKATLDEALITQALMNLLQNAIKYSHDGGEIIISSKIEAGLARMSVKDSGIGIPSKDLPRIFERFYRVDKGRSKELGGTGLGLSIVKHIVQAHGGEVFVESTEGAGSTFGFKIPV